MTTQEEKTQEASQPQKADGFLKRNRMWLILVGLLLVLLAIVYIRSTMTIAQIRKSMVAQQHDLEEQAQHMLASNTEELLLLSIQGFDWAVRGELIRGNEEQVQQYFTQLVKNERVQQVEFIDQDRIIQLSSDKKKESQVFDRSEFETDPLAKNEPYYHVDSLGNILLLAPVMGLERKLGTLMLEYTPQTIAFTMDSLSGKN